MLLYRFLDFSNSLQPNSIKFDFWPLQCILYQNAVHRAIYNVNRVVFRLYRTCKLIQFYCDTQHQATLSITTAMSQFNFMNGVTLLFVWCYKCINSDIEVDFMSCLLDHIIRTHCMTFTRNHAPKENLYNHLVKVKKTNNLLPIQEN